jgi:hypothetical protein
MLRQSLKIQCSSIIFENLPLKLALLRECGLKFLKGIQYVGRMKLLGTKCRPQVVIAPYDINERYDFCATQTFPCYTSVQNVLFLKLINTSTIR